MRKAVRRRVWLSVVLVGAAVLLAWGCQFCRPQSHYPASTYATKDWRPKVAPRDWKWIVVHHSASETGDAATFDDWHRKRGWSELGYDFVIDNGTTQADGLIEVGGRWTQQKRGAHAKTPSGEYNDRGIGICLVGNFENHPPTAAQWRSLVKLSRYLQNEYGISAQHVIGHKDAEGSDTLCPGRLMDLQKLRGELRR